MSTFFETQVKTKESILDDIFNLVYHANFNFNEVWQMPVKYKNHLLSKLVKTKEDENKEIQNEISKSKRKK